MGTERRSGIDRRKQTGINRRTFVGNGARITIRRQEDGDRIFFIDQNGPVFLLTIVAILFLCVIDATLTLLLLNRGSYEINPLMAYLLNIGPYAFFVFKYGLTMIAIVCLLMFRCVAYRNLNVISNTILYFLAWVYAAVLGWELYLVYRFL